MITTTGNDVAGYSIADYIGLVRGIVVRSPTIAQGIAGGLKQVFGGNIEAFADVCETARDEAFQRMVRHAEEMGADAVIGIGAMMRRSFRQGSRKCWLRDGGELSHV